MVKGIEDLTLYIEKGMKTGDEIVNNYLKLKRFDDYGEERIDILPGSLIFVVQEIVSDNVFYRTNDDLNCDIYISLKEALLGFKRTIKHLDDHLVNVNRDTVIQPGHVIKIKGEGMPKHQRSEKGDLFVKVYVIFPPKMNEKQEKSKFLF